MKFRPSEASRVSVQVVLRDRMSISPDCSAVKRCCAVSGTYLTLLASPSDGRGDGPADVDVQARPVALAVGCREAGQAGVDAADELAARLDGVQGLAGMRRHGRHGASGHEGAQGQARKLFDHLCSPLAE